MTSFLKHSLLFSNEFGPDSAKPRVPQRIFCDLCVWVSKGKLLDTVSKSKSLKSCTQSAEVLNTLVPIPGVPLIFSKVTNTGAELNGQSSDWSHKYWSWS